MVEALTRLEVDASGAVEFYLVELLAQQARTTADTLEPLVFRLAEAAAIDEPAERFRRFRAVGDAALHTCGFFADHYERRGVSREYVVTMGGRAYDAAADLAFAARAAEPDVFGELAGRFDAFARVLDEVRETTELRTPQDIVRLYDRWRRTRSPRLAERLRKAGVFPGLGGGGGTLH